MKKKKLLAYIPNDDICSEEKWKNFEEIQHFTELLKSEN